MPARTNESEETMQQPSSPAKVTGTRSDPAKTAFLAFLTLALLLFANGRNTVAVAAWLGAIFLLRFVRSYSPRTGLPIAWLVLTAAFLFQFRGMVPVPPAIYIVIAISYGLVQTIPFLFDRLLAHKIDGFSSTLVLPCSWVMTEYLTATFTPYGSWGAAAYSQSEYLTLIQIVSITGLYGVSFLIAWCAAAVNWAWERQFEWREIRRGVGWLVAVAVVVLVYGGVRLSHGPTDESTVRIASLSKSDLQLIPSQEVEQRVYSGAATAEDIAEIRRRGDTINLDLIRRTEREARAGAKIVFWGESNGFSFKDDEQRFIDHGSKVARDRSIFLGMGLATWNPDSANPLENKLVLITPSGSVAWAGLKAIPVPGNEASLSARDEGKVRMIETDYGRLSSVICFDMDFPGLLHQAGRLQTDIMLVPSNDWREIDPWHTEMARFRAIEQGFNMVRQTSNGLSLATDTRGRVLSRMDHFSTADRVMVSQVPTRGVTTIYSKISDLFAWLCVITLPVLIKRSSR
jgi:apolipoprotein N-acyltransferase